MRSSPKGKVREKERGRWASEDRSYTRKVGSLLRGRKARERRIKKGEKEALEEKAALAT